MIKITNILLTHIVLSFLFSTSVFSQIESSLSPSPPRPPIDQSKQSKNHLQIYKTFLEGGNFLGAKQNLIHLINTTEEKKQKEKFKKELYDLNIKILFSKTATPNSIFYKVKSGDTLGKIARAHNTTIALIKKSNQRFNDLIRPTEKLKIFTGTIRIKIDKSENKLWLIADGEILKEYSVATGKKNSTPIGTYKIESKLEDPTWYHAGAIVPPDSPENILGTRWLGISYPGYGIHGTTLPESIGGQTTAGCIRMLNTDVEELYTIVPYRAEVEIVD